MATRKASPYDFGAALGSAFTQHLVGKQSALPPLPHPYGGDLASALAKINPSGVSNLGGSPQPPPQTPGGPGASGLTPGSLAWQKAGRDPGYNYEWLWNALGYNPSQVWQMEANRKGGADMSSFDKGYWTHTMAGQPYGTLSGTKPFMTGGT